MTRVPGRMITRLLACMPVLAARRLRPPGLSHVLRMNWLKHLRKHPRSPDASAFVCEFGLVVESRTSATA